MRLANLLSILCLLCLISACGSGSSGSKSVAAQDAAQDFVMSDYEGTWSFVNWGSTKYGETVIDSSGTVEDGEWFLMGQASGIYTGGDLTLKEDGSILGHMYSSSNTTYTIIDGQMSISEDLMVYALTDTFYKDEAGISLKRGGAFTLADLEGTWTFAAPDSFGTFSVNDAGEVTSGAFDQNNITGGKIQITGQGAILGSLLTDGPNTFTIQSGQMNLGKNFICIALLDVSYADSALVAIKQESGFSVTDIEGTFKLIQLSDSITYGLISIDSSGSVTGGNWTKMGTGTGTYTGGTFSINTEQGSILGSISTSDSSTFTINSGQMNANKHIALISTNSGLIILIKAP